MPLFTVGTILPFSPSDMLPADEVCYVFDCRFSVPLTHCDIFREGLSAFFWHRYNDARCPIVCAAVTYPLDSCSVRVYTAEENPNGTPHGDDFEYDDGTISVVIRQFPFGVTAYKSTNSSVVTEIPVIYLVQDQILSGNYPDLSTLRETIIVMYHDTYAMDEKKNVIVFDASDVGNLSGDMNETDVFCQYLTIRGVPPTLSQVDAPPFDQNEYHSRYCDICLDVQDILISDFQCTHYTCVTCADRHRHTCRLQHREFTCPYCRAPCLRYIAEVIEVE